MASRHLAGAATGPEDYLAVYDAVLSAATSPVVLHWLGVFDPALDGYWGRDDPRRWRSSATIADHPDTVRGIKVSLLDPALEIALRDQIPAGVRVFTGDDYNYVGLIAGDGSPPATPCSARSPRSARTRRRRSLASTTATRPASATSLRRPRR